ncbi:MAG: M1 family aminopeptidase [Chitinophagaceae bacterium]
MKARQLERPVKIYTACLPAHRRQWKDAPQMVRFALEQYGTRVGPYPYSSLSVVEGDLLAGGGMEYPGVALIDRSAVSALSEVIFHEVGHNWFYGMLASDERSFPWMDEGMNSYYERLTQRQWQQQHGLRSMSDIEDVIPFYLQSVQEDQPADLAAPEYRYVNYGGDIYAKVPLLFESVAACNGTEEVDSMFREYYRSFRFRHPYPADFDTVFGRHFASKGFSSSWLHASLASDQPLSLSIRSARTINHGVQVRLQNKSDIATTALLQIGDSGLLVQKTVLFPAHSDTTLTVDSVASWKYASVTGACTDYSLRDNSVFNRLFRRKGISIGPGFGLQRTPRIIPAAPVPLYNIYDGRSVGVMLHNLSFPLSRFQFIIAPVFSIGSERMNGVAGLSYSWYPRKSFLKELRLQTDLKTFSRDKSDLNINDPLFARYFKEASALEIVFRNKDLVSPVHQHILLRQYHVYEQGFGYSLSPADSLYRPYLVGQSNNYFLVKYAYQNRQTFHPYSYAMQAELGATFVKLGLEARKRIDYDLPHKSLYLRAYAGKFFDLQNTTSNSRYWINSVFTGKNDYLYDALFTGRSEISGFSAAQLYEKEGGAKTPTNQYINPLGRSGNWLLALNLSSDLPLGKLPLRAYLDVQTTADAKRLNPAGNAVSFQSGLELHLIRDLVHIYMPLLLSSDYQDYLKSVFPKGRLLKSVTFSVQITDFNWMRTHERLFGLLVQ